MQNQSIIRPSLLLLGAACLGTFLAVGCSTEDSAQPAPVTTTTTTAALQYSGEDLFKGIFLLNGKVATLIPALQAYRSTQAKAQSLTPAAAQQHEQLVQQLTRTVSTLAPEYFAELKAAVASQDFQQIETALHKGVALQQQALVTVRAGKQAARTLDVSSYDFSQEQEVTRYAHDMQTLHPVNPSQQIDQGDTGYFIVGTAHMVTQYPGTPSNGPAKVAVTEVMQRQASLEKDNLVRDIAFLR